MARSFLAPLVGLTLLCSVAAAAQTAAPDARDTLAQARALLAAKNPAGALALVRPFVAAHPDSGAALLALGNAHRQLGHLAEAGKALGAAAARPGGKVPAALSLLGMYADSGRADEAAAWFDTLKGRADLTTVAATPGLARFHDDPRFAVAFPDRIRFDPPFVEPDARIIHEWRGDTVGDEFGWIARGIGDVDRDGVTDITVSATANPPYGSTRGTVYLYSGRSGKLLWKHAGNPGDLLGIGLETAGDVNGDGVPDVAAGAPGINAVLVLSGRDGRVLLRLAGDSADVNLGSAAGGVGDVNGDGRPDIAAGAPGSNHAGAGAGRVYLFSGRAGRRLLALDGERAGDAFGSTVGGEGGTVIIGAPGAGPRSKGRIYVHQGLARRPRFVTDADETAGALGNMFVSVVGDVDGDRVPDVYASDYTNARSTGRVYVWSGKSGKPILTLSGGAPGEGFGVGPARTGDVDGDGRDDLVLGSWQYGGAAWSGGRIQVFSGKDGRVLQTITGRVPGETLGFDAVGVGDVDGDGATDFLVTSAWSMVNGFRSGRVFVVAGTVRH